MGTLLISTEAGYILSFFAYFIATLLRKRQIAIFGAILLIAAVGSQIAYLAHGEMRHLLLSISVMYVLAFLSYMLYLILKNKDVGVLGTASLSIGSAFLVTYLAAMWITLGRPPWGGIYEFYPCFALSMAVVYLVMEQRMKSRALGFIITPFAGLFVIWFYGMNYAYGPLMPALQSYWMILHVAVAIIAYGMFAIAFCFGVIYLIKERLLLKEFKGFFVTELPDLPALDKLTYITIMAGLPFQALLLILGAVWAEEAWGTYWGWDPKEVWSLITFVIYMIFAHGRFSWGKNIKKLMIHGAVWGFVAVLFTLLGVTYLLPGLHSYK
ncbi:MAG: c-type cytochrome biogenesis protein CcsB [Armatimonadetes bacterium]|nr:c-type cytochrome biogenesis protein CcsB [Armatimonadota bacterium]